MSNAGNGKTIQWLRDHVGHDSDYCLIWPFYRNPNGYGQFTTLGKSGWVHREMCTLVNGPPPTPDHEAAHSCGNGAGGCANPKHLSWKTRTGNGLDCRAHGTHVRSRSGSARLTDAQVDQIKALKGKKTQAEIAFTFGISEPTVRDIFLGRSHAGPSKVNYYSPEDDAKIRDAIARGCSFREIAAIVGRPIHAVSGRVYRMGLKSGQPPRARTSA